MEKIKEFLTVNNGYGYGGGYSYSYGNEDGNGYGSGYGDGSGNGYGNGNSNGYGKGNGYGNGYGYGSGYGSGYGYGYGSGYGNGYGYGYGNGSGYGYGNGYGYGYGDIKSINGRDVHLIDDIQTIITAIHGNTAKGFILNDDMTTTPCYVVKGNDYFAHGETLKKAVEALQDKLFENMDADEAIDKFLETFKPDTEYPAKDFYIWHHRLTGSCEMGRNQFAKQHDIDIEHDKMTVDEFISLTENAYGGETIRKLKERLNI